MKRRIGALVPVLVLLAAAASAQAQDAETKASDTQLGANVSARLMEPTRPGPRSRIALLYTHITGNAFTHPAGRELARRGYRILLLNHSDTAPGFEGIAPAIGLGVTYLRGLPGVEKVVLIGHSGGGPLMTFYQNVAENGPAVAQGPEKIYPARGGGLKGLPKADGLILLDSHLGSGFSHLTYTDPAVRGDAPAPRTAALDMFDPKHGYAAETRGARYSPEFRRAFFAAQAARNAELVAAALEKLKELEKSGPDADAPFAVPGASARLLQADVSLVSRTRAPHPLLKADGTNATQIVQSIRPPSGRGDRESEGRSTVRRFLAFDALRTGADYAMSEDSITGIDWASSNTSAPSNIEGVSVPLLIAAMTAHYFVRPDEIIYEHAKSRDKQIVFVEGATHVFRPLRPEFGDPLKRLFDHVDAWLSAENRFAGAQPPDVGAGANAELGIAAKKPVLGAACKTCPWGALAEVVKAALAPYGYDVQICYNCARADAPRYVADARMPPARGGGIPGVIPDDEIPDPPRHPVEFGVTSVRNVWWAYQGTHQYRGEKPRDHLRLIGVIQQPSYLMVAAKRELGITDLAQIREKRWPVRILARPDDELARAVLAHYGLTAEAVEAAGGSVRGGGGPQNRGDFDVIIHDGTLGNAPEFNVWYEVTQKYDLQFLELPEELLAKLAADFDMERRDVPLGLLRGVRRPIPSVARSGHAVYARADTPADFAYAVARALDEQQELLQWSHLNFSYNSRAVWKAFGVPLHPGAERYYRERAYLK